MDWRFGVSVRWAALAAVILLGVFPLAGRAMAGQAMTSDATIIGQVTDSSKGVLPGVTVTATSQALQVPNVTAVSDDKGEYRLSPLPIGAYTVEYTLSGFQTARRDNVRLTAGFTAKLDIILTVGQLAETVTVSGVAPQVDVASTAAVTQLTREALETIPTGGNGYVGILMMVPGARPGLEVGGDKLNMNPSLVDLGSVSQTWQSVDGVATKNPRNTESGNAFDFAVLEEATAATLGHDADIPNRGLNVNVVLPSGGNQFHGKTFYSGTSSRFEAEAPPQSGGGSVTIRDDLRGDLGGRLVRDRLWFWVGVRNQRNDQEVQGCTKPDGSLCTQIQRGFFVTAKGTAQLGPSNRLISFHQRNRGPRVWEMSPLSPWESRRDYVTEIDVGKMEWQGLKGNSLVMSANYGYWKGHSGTVCPGGPENLKIANVDFSKCEEAGVARTDSVTGKVTGFNARGGERLLESRYQLRTHVAYYKPDLFFGNHEIKAGFDFFRAPQNRHQVGRGGAGNYQLVFRNGVADQILFWNFPLHPDLLVDYYATYVADSWTIGRRLTLNLGIRHAYDVGYENPTCRDAADGPSAVIYPAACFGKTVQTPFNTFAPRLRLSYDLTGNGKTVLKGGWGRYQHMRYADQLLMVARNVLDTSTYKWRDLNGNRNYDPGEVNLNPNGSDFVSRTAAGSGPTRLQGGVVNPDETTPHTDEYSLTLERQLTQTLAVRVTGVERRVGNMQRVVNDLRPYEAYNIPITDKDPGPDGIVGTGDDPGTSITYYDYPASLAGAAFQRVKIINDDKADERYHTLELLATKRLSDNWQFMASHSMTKKHWLVANAGTYNTQDPNAEIFAVDNTWEWLTRVSGSYLFRHGILASANYELRSGDALARTASFRGAVRVGSQTLRVEPIGSIRLPSLNLLNLRGEKRFKLPNGHELLGRVNVYNVLGIDTATSMTVQSGASFGLVTTRVLPRIASFDVQYQF